LSICQYNTNNLRMIYTEYCLNRTSLELTFVFGIDRCLVHTDRSTKYLLHWTLFRYDSRLSRIRYRQV